MKSVLLSIILIYTHTSAGIIGQHECSAEKGSCKINNYNYFISCDVSHKRYVGETTYFRKGANNHRSSFRTKKDLPVPVHFNDNNHR